MFWNKQGRGFLPLVLGAILLLGSIAPVAAIEARSMGNTVYQLTAKKSLRVGYLGGSITAGTGATSQDNCWRAKTTKWLKDTYPDSKIEEINASIGGFGSIPHTFRAKNDLLSQKPDLVFVEAAVNDWNQKEAEVKNAMEGVVRQIYAQNPAADIVFVYTMHKAGAEDSYVKGGTMKTVLWHEQVAQHYGIPSVNCGLDLYQKIEAGELTWETALTDGTHPTDAGYDVYSQSIQTFLKEALSAAAPSAPQNVTLPAKLFAACYDKADIQDAWETAYQGFEKSENNMGGRYPHMLASQTAGAQISVPFRGRTIGLYWLKSIDAGIVQWKVDGGTPQEISGCDATALKSAARGTYNILTTDLSEGEHVLTLTVTGRKSDGATGTWTRIGGFFVAEKSQEKPTLIPPNKPETNSAANGENTVLGFAPRYRGLFRSLGISLETANPAAVTRGEAAKTIADMLKIEQSAAGEPYYTDVPAEHTAFGAVAALCDRGIISGRGGTFEPDRAVTAQELIKMLTCAAGYEPLAKQYGGYPQGYLRAAAEAGILSAGLSGDQVSAAQLENAIFRTLRADMMEIAVYGEPMQIRVNKNKTILTEYHDIYRADGIMQATQDAALGGWKVTSDGFVCIDGTSFYTEEDFRDFLGKRIRYYYRSCQEEDEPQLIYAEENSGTSNWYLTEDIAEWDGKAYRIYENGTTRKQEIPAAADILYNQQKAERMNIDMVPKNGSVELIDNDGDTVWDVVKILDYRDVVVTGVNIQDEVIYNAIVPGEKFELNRNHYRFVNTSGLPVALGDLKKDDVISIAVSPDGKNVYGVVSRFYIQGTVTETYESGGERYLMIGGIAYRVAKDYQGADNAKPGSQVTFYLDQWERVVYAKEVKPAASGYAYLIEIGLKSGIEGQIAQMKLLDTDGKVKIVDAKSTVLVDDSKCTGPELMEKLGTYRGVMQYNVTEDGKVSKIYTAVAPDSKTSTGLYTDAMAGKEYYYRAAPMNFGGKVIMKGSTVVFVVPTMEGTDDSNYRVSDSSAFTNAEYYTVAGYRTDKNKLACDFVVWYEDGGNFSRYTTPITLVGKVVNSVNEEGEPVDKLYGRSRGKEVVYTSSRQGLFAEVKPGDVIRCKASAGGSVVKEPQILYDIEQDKMLATVGSSFASIPWVFKAAVLKIEDDIISLYSGNTPATPEASMTNLFRITDTVPITQFDMTTQGEKISQISIGEMRDYASSGTECTQVIGIFEYGETKELIVIKRQEG